MQFGAMEMGDKGGRSELGRPILPLKVSWPSKEASTKTVKGI